MIRHLPMDLMLVLTSAVFLLAPGAASAEGKIIIGTVEDVILLPWEASRHDFEMERSLTQDERKRCEDWVNAIISENRPVVARYFTEEETKRIPGFCRTRNAVIPARGKIRGIEISGIDIQACGGTHVCSTGEIGRFRIQKVDNKGANLRRIKITLDR